MIRFREYLLVFAVAAVATYLTTFVMRAMAKRHGLVVLPDDRRVHERPTATGGGTGMYVGLLAGMAVASQLPAFSQVFSGSGPFGVVIAATVIFCVGFADDVREMSPPAKLAGQVLAATVLYVFGVNMLFFQVPFTETVLVLTTNWGVLATVLWVAVIANSVNFIDGLDGLAAGIVAIAAAAFFVYSHQLGVANVILGNNAGPLIAVVVVGLCVGFLPHNFHPAKIFMGDAGAMLLGLLVAASTLSVVGQDSSTYSGRVYFFFAPILIPFFILGIPLLDTLFAVLRRAGQRTSPAVADLNHLHHRLMRLGHGQRRAVVVLWAWTALLSTLVLWPTVTNANEVPPIAIGALAIFVFTLFTARGRAGRAAGDNGSADASSGREAPQDQPLSPLARHRPGHALRPAANGNAVLPASTNVQSAEALRASAAPPVVVPPPVATPAAPPVATPAAPPVATPAAPPVAAPSNGGAGPADPGAGTIAAPDVTPANGTGPPVNGKRIDTSGR